MKGCDLNTKMSEENSIPKEFLDTLVNEFAYGPVRLSFSEDPAQVLYNRRTLEKICDTMHSAVNPYSRQPFDIKNSIPQIELSQQMRQYIENNRSLCQRLGFTVIPDYTKVLSETQMKDLLNNLAFNFERTKKIAHLKNESMHRDLQRCWNALWQGFNLLRLYCQYHEENKQLFLSIRGYDYLFQKVITDSLCYLLREYSTIYDDAMHLWNELVKIVDVIVLEDRHLLAAPPISVWGFMRILFSLGVDEYSKIRSSVLRIYCQSMDYFLQDKKFYSLVVHLPIYVLAGLSFSDISIEDLYNGIGILKAAWIKNCSTLDSEYEDYVEAIVNAVIICISRFQEMHTIYIASQGTSNSEKTSRLQEVEKNIYWAERCSTA